MVKLAMHVFVIVTTVQSFFLTNRDLRRFLRFIPRAYNAIDKNDRHFHHNAQCHHHHPDHHHYHHVAHPADYHHAHYDNYHHHDEDYHDHYSHHHLNPHYHPHPGTHRQDARDAKTGCHSDAYNDESDRRTHRRHGTKSKSHKKKTTATEKHVNDEDEIPRHEYEKSAQKDDALEDKAENNKNHLNFKKDYFAGVLVTIPKIEYDPSLESYFHRAQYLNPVIGTLSRTRSY